MNNDNSISMFDIIIMWIFSIPFHIKEYFFPSPIRLKDFIPFSNPKYKENCFYLTFPCYKYQRKRTSAVIDFWKQTCYRNHGDEFVFVDVILGQNFLSKLTIRFRPKNTKETVLINIYDSNVIYNVQITNQQIIELEKLKSYISSLDNLDEKCKNEYVTLLDEMCDEKKPTKPPLKKLFSYIMQNKETIGLVADVTSIIGTILSFFN